MRKILLIEDDPELYELLTYRLAREGYAVVGSRTGVGAVDLCRREAADLVLLDIMLPGCDGFDMCRMIRSTPGVHEVPIIILSARGSQTDRIVGLELGANDYVVKPFSMRELIARINTHFRPTAPTANVLRAGDLELNRQACRVTKGGIPVELTATEFRLLDFLMSRPGMVFSRGQLLDAIWGTGRRVGHRTVDVFILRLRRKLELDGDTPPLIRAVRAFGYTFEDEAAHASPVAVEPEPAQEGSGFSAQLRQAVRR